MVYFAVITKVADDMEGNYAIADFLISPKHKKEHPYLAGAGFVCCPPSSVSEPLMEAMVRRHVSYVNAGKGPTSLNLDEEQLFECLIPVFSIGEILIMDEINDRSIPDGRKPNKWDVKYDRFPDLESAIKRAKEVV